MARSARPGFAAWLIVGALAGCATTQQEASRLQLNSARLRATEVPVRVTQPDPRVRPAQISVVRGPGGAAIVVTLHNPASGPTSDRPISVGIETAHRRRYLNAAAGIGYFQTHVPPIPAGGTLTWVFRTSRPVPLQARPFADVGAPVLTPAGVQSRAPQIAVGALLRRGRELALTVRNDSSVPQYQLQLYAVARRAGRYLAAGTASIAHLAPGTSSRQRIRLTGRTGSAALLVQVPPTIFG